MYSSIEPGGTYQYFEKEASRDRSRKRTNLVVPDQYPPTIKQPAEVAGIKGAGSIM
jgi:hypothetical protein